MSTIDHRFIVEVALPVPLRKIFDYHTSATAMPQPGMRVRVLFGSRALIGVVVGVKNTSEIDHKNLKPIDSILDETPILPADVMAFCKFAADYYHHPLGEVLQHALPNYLRKHDHIKESKRKTKQISSPPENAHGEIGPQLNAQQQSVIASIREQCGQFQCFLLQGI